MKNKAYIIIDMQNDFLVGSLANPAANALVDDMVKFILSADENTQVIATMDTHDENYLNTSEGKYLPVPHCEKYSFGWLIQENIRRALHLRHAEYIEKPTFGYKGWDAYSEFEDYDEIDMVGTCTDICVISNALLLKTLYPNVKIVVYENLCAGLSEEAHNAALTVMKNCQIEVKHWGE